MDEAGITTDRLLGGAVALLQPRRGHRAGTDAVLLAALAPVRPGDRVVDLGASTGAVGLMIACRVPTVRVAFVERDPELGILCGRNAALNGMVERTTVVAADILTPDGLGTLEAGGADLVVTNPPFFAEGSPASPDPGRRAAHVLEGGDLASWIAAAARCLPHRGRLALIHRAEALPDCLASLRRHFGSIEVVPILPRADMPALRIVVRAVKGGRAPLRLLPPLILHGDDGRFTDAAQALHAHP